VHVAYNQVYVIRILTETALTLLWECLGVVVGLGKGKPTKIQLLVYCCINDIVTSIEAGASMPNEFTVNRKQRSIFYLLLRISHSNAMFDTQNL
jgi:hypothetical protein